MSGDGVEADLAHVVDGRAQADRAGDIRGAGFEAMGRLAIRRRVHRDQPDHSAAGLVRRHFGQKLAARPQRADAGRTVELVAGKDVEIAAERPHVERQVRRGLGAIDENERSAPVGQLGDRRHWHDRARDIGDVGDGHEARAIAETGFDVGHGQNAVLRHRNRHDLGASGITRDLPRHQIGVVLELGDRDLVTLAEVAASPAVGDQVDPLGGAAYKDDLIGVAGTQERGDFLASALVRGR